MKNLFRSPLALIVLSVAVIGTGVVVYLQFYSVAPQQYRSQAASGVALVGVVMSVGLFATVSATFATWGLLPPPMALNVTVPL